MNTFLHIIVIFAAFGGFLLAFYIRHKKQKRETMVCPLDSDCDAVIYSPYSKFFGIPVEILGLLYYGVVAIAYACFVVFPTLIVSPSLFTVLLVTTAALLFSLYLTFLQAFTIRQWCTWCLMSAGLCAIIFASALAGSEFRLTSLLVEHRTVLGIIHLLGVALGVGGATFSDVFFFKFLKDFRISEWEADVMHTFSNIIWFALAILVISGFGLYLPNSERLNQSPKFLVKITAVSVIVVNGALLNLLIAPKLAKISFGEKHEHKTGELRRLRKAAFALGAVSITSWYTALILGSLREMPFNFSFMLGAYIMIVFTAMAISQIFEHAIAKGAASPDRH